MPGKGDAAALEGRALGETRGGRQREHVCVSRDGVVSRRHRDAPRRGASTREPSPARPSRGDKRLSDLARSPNERAANPPVMEGENQRSRATGGINSWFDEWRASPSRNLGSWSGKSAETERSERRRAKTQAADLPEKRRRRARARRTRRSRRPQDRRDESFTSIRRETPGVSNFPRKTSRR